MVVDNNTYSFKIFPEIGNDDPHFRIYLRYYKARVNLEHYLQCDLAYFGPVGAKYFDI